MQQRTYDQSLAFYATAPKITAGIIWQKEGSSLLSYWCGKLRGQFVKSGPGWKASTKEQAIENARRFRNECLIEAKAKGLISD
ncbi:hypothetical protein [Pseudomonas savastanoi]|uniref:hypothetical protein n=1 Tax=Pseudomonas savastanoi TaxID=29438 RepID=UPI00178348A0|nr:hypothetical protein [Pseudomonas savastanoi]